MWVYSTRYIDIAKRDGQNKPQFDYFMWWWCYYGCHILMEHYLNSLCPSFRPVSYTSEMWKKGQKRERKRKRESESSVSSDPPLIVVSTGEELGHPVIIIVLSSLGLVPILLSFRSFRKLVLQRKLLLLFDHLYTLVSYLIG